MYNKKLLPAVLSSAGNTAGLRFGLSHLLYITAQIGASLALFGKVGMLVAGGIVFFWWGVLNWKSRPVRVLQIFTAVFIVLFSYWLFSYGMVCGYPARKAECSTNLSQLSRGLLQYCFTEGEFPPVCTYDDQGQPLHSWRVLMLPYLNENALFAKYNQNEPWDGPNNSKLAGMMPKIYRCPTRGKTGGPEDMFTPYVAYRGGNSPWGGKKLDPSTLLLVETHEQSIHWMSPHDPDADQLFQILMQGSNTLKHSSHVGQDFFSIFALGRNVAFSNGQVAYLPEKLPPRLASQLVDGVDDPFFEISNELRKLPPQEYRWRYENIVRLSAFVVVSFFPLVWLRRRPRN